MSTNSSTVVVVKPVLARSVASFPVRLYGDENADSRDWMSADTKKCSLSVRIGPPSVAPYCQMLRLVKVGSSR